MLPRKALLAGAGLAALTCACSSVPSSRTPDAILPLRTLRLYETGVGYFERSGELSSPNAAALPLPAGHMDDALKTLVVLGRGGRPTVQGVEFGSSISRGMARALAGLPVQGDEPLSLQQLLVGLKGAGVDVRSVGGQYSGRIVDVVEAREDGVATKDASGATEAQADPAKTPPHSTTLNVLLLTDAGAVVRIPAAELKSVRPLDPSYSSRLGSALDALSTRGAQGERLLHVLGQGGPVTIGYVAETPVWRTTYRLILDDGGSVAMLQGWALVHNDTDEDWRGVHVELANGRPDSFLFPLAAPRYARRELLTPDDHLATVPQLMGTTVDSIWGDQIEDAEGSGGLGLIGHGEGGGGRGEGFGYGHGRLGTSSSASIGSSSLLEVGNLASAAPATGVEAGALFVYTLPAPVDLHAHHSALVPFVQQRIEATPVAWIGDAGDAARSAVRFVNSTSQTLPAGTIALFGGGGFAGESSLSRLKPGERRFVTYGMDLDVELNVREQRATDEAKKLVWDVATERLEEHYLRTSDFTYSIENRSGHPRSVLLSLAINRNATLTGADGVDFDAATARPIAVFATQAGKRSDRRLHTVEGLVKTSAFASLTAKQLGEMAAAATLEAGDRAAATEAAARLREAEDDARAAGQAKADIASVEKDLVRLREHMKAASGDRAMAGANPFAPRVLAGEDRLTALRKKLDGLEADGKTKAGAAKVALARLARGPGG